MSDTSLPTNPTPNGPLVPQGIQGLLEEVKQANYDTDILLASLQGSPGLTAPQVQAVKDARNGLRASELARAGIEDRGGDGNPIP